MTCGSLSKGNAVAQQCVSYVLRQRQRASRNLAHVVAPTPLAEETISWKRITGHPTSGTFVNTFCWTRPGTTTRFDSVLTIPENSLPLRYPMCTMKQGFDRPLVLLEGTLTVYLLFHMRRLLCEKGAQYRTCFVGNGGGPNPRQASIWQLACSYCWYSQSATT